MCNNILCSIIGHGMMMADEVVYSSTYESSSVRSMTFIECRNISLVR